MKISRQHYFALLLVLLCTLFILPGESFQNALRYDRDAILQGEIWRLLTAHLLHLGSSHLMMNIAGLLLVFVFFGRCLSLKGWLIATLVCGLLISLIMLGLHPQVYWYVGLSGVLHGLFVAGGLADTSVRPVEGWVFLALIALKLLWENVFGPLPGSEQLAGGPVLIEAHLYGALTALLLWPWLRRMRSLP